MFDIHGFISHTVTACTEQTKFQEAACSSGSLLTLLAQCSCRQAKLGQKSGKHDDDDDDNFISTWVMLRLTRS